ncbi:C-type lectin domain family 17, member A-like [Amblyraja radiata]|uniref:C-type lectin domain family 17, member A-like n=1 Tax=Amblyraja radiata TaxID=386614 RepID=UPI001403869F|nr:C-type lectin domain family 17, member A-like [Amblyraja radiata]
MEGMDIYENTTVKNGGESEPEGLNPEHWPRRADTARQNLQPKIIYTLLGICVLGSVSSLVLAIVLMAQMGEMKGSDADLRMEISQWKSIVTGDVEKATSSLSDVQAEIALLREHGLSCPEQWTKFKQSCYHFSSSTNTWVEAQRICASADAHLVVINNAEEQSFLKKRFNVGRWIGLSDSASEGDWRWVDGTDYQSTVTFWDKGEPNDANNGEDCGEINGVGQWNDQPCENKQKWICEKPAQCCSP